MARTVLGMLVFLTALTGAARAGGDPTDALKAGTVWKGEIHQDDMVFPASLHITERDKDRIKGELHFKTGDATCELRLQGNVAGKRRVAWITELKSGPATSPGLYIGTVDGDRLTGTWQVPSANQHDRFTLKLEK